MRKLIILFFLTSCASQQARMPTPPVHTPAPSSGQSGYQDTYDTLAKETKDDCAEYLGLTAASSTAEFRKPCESLQKASDLNEVFREKDLQSVSDIVVNIKDEQAGKATPSQPSTPVPSKPQTKKQVVPWALIFTGAAMGAAVGVVTAKSAAKTLTTVKVDSPVSAPAEEAPRSPRVITEPAVSHVTVKDNAVQKTGNWKTVLGFTVGGALVGYFTGTYLTPGLGLTDQTKPEAILLNQLGDICERLNVLRQRDGI